MFRKGAELRVEQIGPDLWVGAIYYGLFDPDIPGIEPTHQWATFTALSEDAAKNGAIATVSRLAGTDENGEWRNLSDISDADWKRRLDGYGFPGYPKRDGMERWGGF
jgi:hypothetical protein